MTPILVADDVVKTYRVGVGRARVREMTPPPFDRGLERAFPRWWRRDTFNAVDGVSFDVERGSAVGLIGHNGAGKTTLLKLISGVTAPSSGTISVAGRVAAILDVTVGFHPELTGRENLFLVGNMYGLSRREVLARQEQIEGFAELGDLIDTPIKRYSAGMVARLGFATLASVEADVLLVDEVLAVGDATFQRKCIEWLDAFWAGGGTLVFVSHNLGLIRHMTERVLWLDHGRVNGDGPTGRVLAEYGLAAGQRRTDGDVGGHRSARKAMRAKGLDRWGAGGVRVSDVEVVQDPTVDGRGVDVTIRFDTRASIDRACFSVGFIDEGGHELGASVSWPVDLEASRGVITWRIERLPLRPGVFFPVVCVLSPEGSILDRWKLDRPVVLEMDGEVDLGLELGPTDFGGEWFDERKGAPAIEAVVPRGAGSP
jgi:ABC-type polysaccharide/polyol phosphate transport system ATPase subunit